MTSTKRVVVTSSATTSVVVEEMRIRSKKENNLRGCFDVLLVVWDFFGLVPKGYEFVPEGTELKVNRETEALRDRTVAKWIKMSGDVHWVKFMKYKLAAWFAAHLDQPLPAKPEGMHEEDKANILIGGALGRLARTYIRKYPVVGDRRTDETAIKGMEFLNSVLNAKKGMPRMDSEDLEKAARDTVKDLTEARKPIETVELGTTKFWGDYKDNSVVTEVSLFNLLYQVRRTAREVFGKVEYTDSDRVLTSLPSTSANYNFSRGKGGGYEALLDSGILDQQKKPGGFLKVYVAEKRYDTISLSERIEEEEGLEEGRHPSVLVDAMSEKFETFGGVLAEFDEVEGSFDDTRIFVVDDRALLDQTTIMTRNVTAAALEEKPYVKPVALAEPLKARVITAGPPLTYYALRPIWKKMHTTMRHMKLFKLIGQPDTAELMLELLGTPKGRRNYFVSGDYKGATNEINPLASNEAVETISECFNLNEDERILFKRSLTEHIFMTKGEQEEQKQMWGQLMGSVTSFPILCIINAAVTRWSMEINEDRDIPLANLNAGINGDDVVMRTERGIEKTYETVAASAGLLLSVGKTFYHTDFFNINSRSYVVLEKPLDIKVDIDWGRWSESEKQAFQELGITQVERKQPFVKTSFVNMGQLLGLKRSEDQSKSAKKFDDLASRAFSPAARAKDILQETPTSVLEKVWKFYKRANREFFKSTRLPWYMPVWIGGLGLPRILPEDQNSELDLRLAQKIIFDWKKRRPTNLSADSPWQIRKIVRDRLPSPVETIDREATGVAAFKRLTQLATVNLLFDEDLELKDVYKEMGTDPVYRALSHNRKLWAPPKNGKLPPPIDQRVLDSMHTQDSMPVVFLSDIGDYWDYKHQQSASSNSEGPNVGLLQDISEPVLEVPDVGARAPTCKELAQSFLAGDDRVARDQVLLASLCCY